MSSTNNKNGKGKDTFPKEGLPITFKQGNHSRKSADLVVGHPKTMASSSKIPKASSSKTGNQGSSSSEVSDSERERQFKRSQQALESKPYPSSSSGSDSGKKAKTDSTKKAKK
ncbi:hypothetical protein EAF00_002518 [Botryotinia globosa]|nr:hypothetical protein EAF00_002518 [Botryotinia globosa]